ncbi:MAG TPA: hypothetical protein PKA05_13835, partial [Roseiflexaceae bacterium]|nr:hypothetical protein [Roseiflexaceae bacterium]
MTDKQPLYILFTMECNPIPRKTNSGDAPRTWEISSRSIETYTYRVLSAGFAVTLFVDPWCAEEHTPLLEELMAQKVEIGTYVHPPNMLTSPLTRHLGTYAADDQRTMIEHATDRFYEALGIRPRSFRGGRFSANDESYKVLYDLGYRQGSLSRPGFDARIYHAFWDGAALYPHYVDPSNRLAIGSLPFLELPLTCDPQRSQEEHLPIDLTIENGTFEALIRPVIDVRLAHMAEVNLNFRTLCITTANNVPYDKDDNKHVRTLDLLLDYLDELAQHYTLQPVTLAAAHEQYRR